MYIYYHGLFHVVDGFDLLYSWIYTMLYINNSLAAKINEDAPEVDDDIIQFDECEGDEDDIEDVSFI